MTVTYKLIHKDAKFDKKHDGDAGFDLYALTPLRVLPNSVVKIQTGVVITKCPKSLCGIISERSGLALRSSIRIGGGIVDSCYRGEVCVIFHNLGDEAFEITKGQAVAQIVFVNISTDVVLSEDGAMDESDRNANGFGSTG